MPRFEPHPERRPALVTGASSGFGAGIARGLAAAGHPVVLAARRLDRLEALAAEIGAAGGEAAIVALDLYDDESIDAAAERAATMLGPLDIVVSNAGTISSQPTLAEDPADFVRSMQLNVLGVQRLLARLGPAMVERGHGDIVVVSSDTTVNPRPSMAGYVAAKTALEALARVMRMELEGTGVRVGVVRPGPGSTEQGTDWDEETVLRIVPQWERWGLLRHDGALRPEALAPAVLAMVSAPKGTHLALIDVQPEAPVRPDRTHR